MALAYSNTVKKPSDTSATGNPFLNGYSSSLAGNVSARTGGTSPLAMGVSTLPSLLQPKTTASTVVKGTAPYSQVPIAATASKPAAVNTANVGTYKGVTINPGADADISKQIAKIDSDANLQQAQAQNLATAPILPGGAVGAGAASTSSSTGAKNSTQTDQGGTPTYGGIVGSLVKASTQPSTGYTQAQDAYSKAVADKAKLESNIAGQYGAIEGQAIPLGFQQGREQALARQYASQEAAAQGAVTASQQGVSNALTQSGQQISGLGTAAGYAQPQVTGYGQTTFNPLNQQFGNGQANNLDPQQYATQLAQAVKSGQIPYDQAVSSLGYAGGAGKAFLDQSLTAGGANIAQLQGQASAAQSNAATAGTAATSIAASGLADATHNYVSANTAFQQASGQAANLQATMSGINGLNSKYANTTINNLKNQFGSAEYTSFLTALNESRQAYTQLLASVGAATPTVNGQQADAILDAASTPKQINAAIDALNNAAYAKLLPLYNQIGTYQGNLGGGAATAPASSSGDSLYHW